MNPLNSSTASEINDYPSLIWFVNTPEEGEKACQALTTVAECHIKEMRDKGESQKVYFFYDVAKEDEGIGESLRVFATMPQTNPMLALIDINSQKVHAILYHM